MATLRKPAAVSMDPLLFERAKERAVALGFPTFSAYVTQLIRADILGGGEMSVREGAITPPVTESRREVLYQKIKKLAQEL